MSPVSSQQHWSLSSTASSGERDPGHGLGLAAVRVLKTNGTTGSLDSLDHRVILQPGTWKIRAPDKRHGAYFAYHFFLGFNWTELEIDYPECPEVACRGLPDAHKGCDHLCSTGTWRDANIALRTATLEYKRAMASLDAAFNDLAALMDSHIVSQHWSVSDVSKLLSYRGSKLSPASDPQVVDVMRHYRTSIDEALEKAKEYFPSTFSSASLFDIEPNVHGGQPVSGSKDTSNFNELLDTWKSGAFKLAVQLNAITFAFQRAHQRLLLCAQGVQRSDMTGCEPGFIAEFHTDIPVASRSLSSSRLVMVVKRESWSRVVLSHWFMPFLDSSRGNRTCWLDRHMVSDEHANYRMPLCDSRGICDPLELDDETVSECEVNENGEISLECPVSCGEPCFGPICYQPQSDTYTLRTSSGSGARGIDEAMNKVQSPVRVTKSPRMLSKVYSLSEADIQASLDSVRDRSARSSELLQRGRTVLKDIIAMELDARKYIDKVYAEKAAGKHSQGNKCFESERVIDRSQVMAATSIALSALTCPILIVVLVKMRCSRTRNQDVAPVRTNVSFTETLL